MTGVSHDEKPPARGLKFGNTTVCCLNYITLMKYDSIENKNKYHL